MHTKTEVQKTYVFLDSFDSTKILGYDVVRRLLNTMEGLDERERLNSVVGSAGRGLEILISRIMGCKK